jgi:hypothetical protein
MNFYFGDLHAHCDTAYGHGSLTAALARAREQLDFCAVPGQASWPDMMPPEGDYKLIVERHNAAFAKYAGLHDQVLKQVAKENQPEEFVAFQGYEICSTGHGDLTVISPDDDLPLILDAETARGVAAGLPNHRVIAYPHHIGYAKGYRGIDWDEFDEALAPIVEIFSLHGCTEDDWAPNPMRLVNGMTFRDGSSTASHGLLQGKKFGLVGGTDHHSAWPGSHGDGRFAVLAESLDRDAIWEAIQKRHVVALTGDNVRIRFEMNDALTGDAVEDAGRREIRIDIDACDFIDTIDLLRNEECFAHWRGSRTAPPVPDGLIRAKLRIEWGRLRGGQTVDWDGTVRVPAGCLESVEPCFHGPRIVSLFNDAFEEPDLPHHIEQVDDSSCAWQSRMHQIKEEFTAEPQAVNLTVQMPAGETIHLDVNGHRYSHTLEELLQGSRVHSLRGLYWENVRFCRAVPESDFRWSQVVDDEGSGAETDFYRLRVRQTNGQMAWTSPIWVSK